MQDAIQILHQYWTGRGCILVQPFNTEVGAGTMNPATILRVLGPEPWHVAYVEPSVRPDDSRYGDNPNRLQTHTQYQVILKPDPGDPQELYLGSLRALGIDIEAHDVRFVEDNWAQPAIGAWGLGWEVWLDGMEITQFTYFQQVGGQNLDPVAVELTYGLERILMAVQGVTHFKDIQYATGISYGEAFGQSEYEMSRYYLDDADVDTNRTLFDLYTREAARLVELRLPVPAHTYVLKSSHAFNVLDARGAVSTTERARAFSTMRRLARDVCALWAERRAELGHPLGRADGVAVPALVPTPDAADAEPVRPVTAQTFALEIGVEELPPHVVSATVEAVRAAVVEGLGRTRLDHGAVTVDGTPRRVVVIVEAVAPREPDAQELAKGPKWAAAFDADGQPTPALRGFLRGRSAEPGDVVKAQIGGNDHAAVAVTRTGRDVLDVLAALIGDVVTGLRADKNMRWGDPRLTFSRPIRWLVALWGPVVVPAQVSGLTTGRTTYLHRTDARPFVPVATAGDLRGVLAGRGIEVDFARRREVVVAEASRLAGGVGGSVDVEGEAALVDEIANLVEQPHPILGSFDPRYLELPEQVLTTVMRKHQRYLPVRDADGNLLPSFVTMANGDCDDKVVAAGNESVLRARCEDASFFWRADLAVPLADFRARLSALTFEDRLGSVADRADRIRDVSARLAGAGAVAADAADRAVVARAGALAKFDLATQTVVESSSLAGYMAREFALRAGEPAEVAEALAGMEQPRTAGGAVPSTLPGALLSLADRLDLLAAMFAIGVQPTGSSDQFGMRRAALGVVAVLRAVPGLGAVSVRDALDLAAGRLREQVDVDPASTARAAAFTTERFVQQLRDEGVPVALVAAVTPSLDVPGRVGALLAELRALADDARFRSLAAALQRVARIVPAGTAAGFDVALLTDPAEQRLVEALALLEPGVTPSGGPAAFSARAGDLAGAVDAFFEAVLVMAPEPDVRAARLGLLASVLAVAPAVVDWTAVPAAIGL